MLDFYSLTFHGYSVALLIAIFILSLFVAFPISSLYYRGKISSLNIKVHSGVYENSKLKNEIQTLTERLQERDQDFGILRSEISKKEIIISALKNKISELNNAIKEKNQHAEILKNQHPTNPDIVGAGMSRAEIKEHYGDYDFWDGKRLYDLMSTSTHKLSYRDMEGLTGIKYSTIHYRINRHIRLNTTVQY